MVGVAQLVEPRIVIPVVVGSSPIVHPIFLNIYMFELIKLEIREKYNQKKMFRDISLVFTPN